MVNITIILLLSLVSFVACGGGHGSPIDGYTTPSSSTRALSNKQVDHTHLLFSDISQLYLSERFSDVVLVVGGEKLHAHRFLLALNSEYFRVLFYGGLKETFDKEVEIKETPVALFKILLKYFYTDRIHLKDIEVKEVFELLDLADFFDTLNLNRLLHEYLRRSIITGNVCLILSTARLYEYEELEAELLDFIKKNAWKILREGDLQHFSFEDLQAILNFEMKRDTFHTNELDIFHAVCRWIQCNQDELHRDTKVKVVSSVINPLMYDYLLSEAKNFPLVGSDIILDAIKLRKSSREKPQYRGQLKPNENLANNAMLVKDRDDCGNNMMMLENPSIINNIEIIIWFGMGLEIDQLRSYSYYIEVSMDGYNWTRIIDYSNYNCRSRQHLWICPQAVWYIRVVGVNCDANAKVHIDKVCYDTKNIQILEIDNGLVVPKAVCNVARSYYYGGGIVIEGQNSVINKTFLNNSYKDNIRNGVYTYHPLPGSIVVHLTQPYILGSMRMLLWGGDDQTYKYKVESSVDGQNWKMIVDKSKELARSWQVLQFERMTILYIRITGVYSSSDNEFRCVYFETPSQVTSESNVVVEFMRNFFIT